MQKYILLRRRFLTDGIKHNPETTDESRHMLHDLCSKDINIHGKSFF